MIDILSHLKALGDAQAKKAAANAALELIQKAQGTVEELKAIEQQCVDDLCDALAADGFLIRTGFGDSTTTSTTTTTLPPGNGASPPTEGTGIVEKVEEAAGEVASRIPV